MEEIRITKLLSMKGICSRREAEAFIDQGLVYVDGKKVDQQGTKALPTAEITLGGDAKEELQKKVTILLNKPVGYVSNLPEKGYVAAAELIHPENRFGGSIGFKHHFRKLAVAGRLDIDSKGLLVLTQDGATAKLLIGENSPIEKEYLVFVKGDITPQKLSLLSHGLKLDGKPLKRAKVTEHKPGLLRFILQEGKKRQIRRMCDLVDLQVVSLKRVRIGKVKLGDLPEGKWRYLRENEYFS